MNKIKTNFWIDVVLFILFVLVMLPDGTGIKAHQWIGIVLGVGGAVHVVLHWTWIKTVFKNNRKPGRVRRLFRVDVALGLTFFETVITGLLISPLVGNPDFVHLTRLHHMGAVLFVIFSIMHLVMHWKWIQQSFRRYVFGERRTTRRRETGHLSPQQ